MTTIHVSDAAREVIDTEHVDVSALFAEHRKNIGTKPGVLTRAFLLHRGGPALVFCTDQRIMQTLVVTGAEYQAEGQDPVVLQKLAEWARTGMIH
jgi:hypothetical protein